MLRTATMYKLKFYQQFALAKQVENNVIQPPQQTDSHDRNPPADSRKKKIVSIKLLYIYSQKIHRYIYFILCNIQSKKQRLKAFFNENDEHTQTFTRIHHVMAIKLFHTYTIYGTLRINAIWLLAIYNKARRPRDVHIL